MIFCKKEVHIEVSPSIILTLYPGSTFIPSICTAISYALTMFPTVFAALLTGSLPLVAYSSGPYINDTILHANETASNKDSWLGWVSISRGCCFFLVTFGYKAHFGSIEFIFRPASPLRACPPHLKIQLERTVLTANSAIGC